MSVQEINTLYRFQQLSSRNIQVEWCRWSSDLAAGWTIEDSCFNALQVQEIFLPSRSILAGSEAHLISVSGVKWTERDIVITPL